MDDQSSQQNQSDPHARAVFAFKRGVEEVADHPVTLGVLDDDYLIR